MRVHSLTAIGLADDQCAGHCCADETVAPAVSMAGLSLALQSFVSVSHLQFARRSADAPVLQILPNRSSRLMRLSHLTRPPSLRQVSLSLSNLFSRVPICNFQADWIMLPCPADSADPSVTPNPTVPPGKTVASTAGFCLALQSSVLISDLQFPG